MAECLLGGGDKPVDRGGGEAEEVEVARFPLHVAAEDEGGAARDGFFEAGDDLGRPAPGAGSACKLELAVASEPAGPRAADGRWEDELVPEVEQLVGLDVVANVVVGASRSTCSYTRARSALSARRR